MWHAFFVSVVTLLLANVTNVGATQPHSGNLHYFCDHHQCCPSEDSPTWMFCPNRDISEIHQVSISGKVVMLNLRENLIKSLDNSSFANASGLQVLDLSFNKIDTVGAFSFTRLTRLTALSLAHNRLWSIMRDTFAGLENLLKLDMGYNRIQLFFGDDFERLTNLDELILEHNPLIHLDAERFLHVKRLRSLNLNSVGLRALERDLLSSVPWLTTLVLSGNAFEEIPSVALENLSFLKTLDMSRNPVKVLQRSSFRNLPSLRTLILNDLYSLSSIDAFAFGELQSLKELYLNYNSKLKRIDDVAFISPHTGEMVSLEELHLRQTALELLSPRLIQWDKMAVVDLSENPWHCDCGLAWMLKLGQKIKADPHLRCRSPSHLEGRLIPDMHPEEFICKPPRWSILTISLMLGGILVAMAFVALLIVTRRRRAAVKQMAYRRVENDVVEEKEL
ncbi:carboxypeptidase N subunit 2-like [Ornithodoros turicata]|uniref:carboxypeptidase N subunit 2-like n=1 Tax=Ornithodoros turicata TaxID=34597 RepID=UPI003139C005